MKHQELPPKLTDFLTKHDALQNFRADLWKARPKGRGAGIRKTVWFLPGTPVSQWIVSSFPLGTRRAYYMDLYKKAQEAEAKGEL